MDLIAGQTLDCFETKGRLNASGMGVVYRSPFVQPGRDVAAKVVGSHPAERPPRNARRAPEGPTIDR